MTASLKTMMADLDPARRRKIEDRAAELIAEEMTLRRTVEAMGGSLSLIARFPDRPPVELSGLAEPEPRD